MWRRYDSHVEALSAECAQALLTDEPFAAIGTPVGGGTSAIPVKMQRSGLPAYVKPARIGPANGPDAAHEKIAADLGYRLGLPVAPVILSKSVAGAPLPPLVVVSYV